MYMDVQGIRMDLRCPCTTIALKPTVLITILDESALSSRYRIIYMSKAGLRAYALGVRPVVSFIYPPHDQSSKHPVVSSITHLTAYTKCCSPQQLFHWLSSTQWSHRSCMWRTNMKTTLALGPSRSKITMETCTRSVLRRCLLRCVRQIESSAFIQRYYYSCESQLTATHMRSLLYSPSAGGLGSGSDVILRER